MNTIVCEANVQRYYGDKPDLLEKYRKISENDKCPFCSGNIENELVGDTRDWIIVKNQFPYKNSQLHLLILPKRHVISFSEVSLDEMANLSIAIMLVKELFTCASQGCGLAVREGEMGGITLYHLHIHFIVPQVGGTGPIPVNFGIG